MSLSVFIIAACHGIPPIVGAVARKSKAAVYVGAAIGVAIAIASGSPAYAVADLVGVALGTSLALSMVQKKPE